MAQCSATAIRTSRASCTTCAPATGPGIVGDFGVTEAGIQIALVGRVEDGVEAFVEEERDGVVHEAVVPLIRCADAPGLRDARDRHALVVDGVEQDTAGRVGRDPDVGGIGGGERRGDEGPHAVTVRGDAADVDVAEARQDGDGGVRAEGVRLAGALLERCPRRARGAPRAWV